MKRHFAIFSILVFVSFCLMACSVVPFQPALTSSAKLYNSQYVLQFSETKNNERYYGEKNRLLWLYDLCIISHYAKNHKASNQTCQQAEGLVENLQKISISESVQVYFSDSNARSYSGYPFEKHFLHAIGMINYSTSGNTAEALIESRRLDISTNSINKKDISLEESFGRYLSALIYESEGNMDSALIDYRKAFHGYLENNKKLGLPYPSMIGNDLQRAFLKMDSENQYELYKNKYFLPEPVYPLDKGRGEVILIIEAGLAPYRATEFFSNTSSEQPFGIFKDRFPLIHHAVAKVVDGQQSEKSTKVYDTRLVLKDFEQQKIRAEIDSNNFDFIADHNFSHFGGSMGTYEPVADNERADVRSWFTLPGAVHFLRMSLLQGKHDLAVKYYSYYNEEIYRQLLEDVVVRANKRTFLFVKLP